MVNAENDAPYSRMLGVKQVPSEEICPIHHINKIKVIGSRIKIEPYCPKCESEAREKELDQLADKVKKDSYLSYLKNYSLFDRKDTLNYTFDNFKVAKGSKEELVKNMTRKIAGEYYKDKDKKFNSLFFGKSGTGKTHLAMAILNAVNSNAQPMQRCLFLSVTKLLDAKRDYFTDPVNHLWSKDYTERVIKDADLVVLDDLGAESAASQANNFIQDTIFSLYELNQRVITTTNLSMNELKAKYHERLISRILEGGKGHLIDFTNLADKRMEK